MTANLLPFGPFFVYYTLVWNGPFYNANARSIGSILQHRYVVTRTRSDWPYEPHRVAEANNQRCRCGGELSDPFPGLSLLPRPSDMAYRLTRAQIIVSHSGCWAIVLRQPNQGFPVIRLVGIQANLSTLCIHSLLFPFQVASRNYHTRVTEENSAS
ncbi:hypothetical protein P170DRAFT_52174 [Aspergillus steynii IBT 23096]|uniref:Uncharacterized protein n=1 Tax=Aspergillus steynii IBT 23096 TaxID=1392250 RepID=A0A2I2GSN1_9EURO|nr:uncharacterized protein P170DRAFT_52174 [Aspergillus steynii IBT 23096]PLB55887.1 hypothetical protein P170DRAFT_52174 [Aspergillus steynii IBT 23096]